MIIKLKNPYDVELTAVNKASAELTEAKAELEKANAEYYAALTELNEARAELMALLTPEELEEFFSK